MINSDKQDKETQIQSWDQLNYTSFRVENWGPMERQLWIKLKHHSAWRYLWYRVMSDQIQPLSRRARSAQAFPKDWERAQKHSIRGRQNQERERERERERGRNGELSERPESGERKGVLAISHVVLERGSGESRRASEMGVLGECRRQALVL